jgi:parallel beta-helix repeat protein
VSCVRWTSSSKRSLQWSACAGTATAVCADPEPGGAFSGGNRISYNTLGSLSDYGVKILTDSNQITGNRVHGQLINISIQRHGNIINGNVTGYLNGSCGCWGIWLTDGADSNFISNNQVTAGEEGFLVEADALSNLIRGNTTTPGPDGDVVDALDVSGACVKQYVDPQHILDYGPSLHQMRPDYFAQPRVLEMEDDQLTSASRSGN